jgi:hypothetical protein
MIVIGNEGWLIMQMVVRLHQFLGQVDVLAVGQMGVKTAYFIVSLGADGNRRARARAWVRVGLLVATRNLKG